MGRPDLLRPAARLFLFEALIGILFRVRFLLTIQYVGTRYAGWQSQANATGIQQVIETSLSSLCGEPIRLSGAGRTDSGVHASGQRAHADIPLAIDERGLILGINTRLPDDIRVVDAERVEDDFHSRFEPHEKTYEYRIWNALVVDVFRRANHAHVPQPLDVDRMASAIGSIIGHHDFQSFTVADPEVSSTWRSITQATVAIEPPTRIEAERGRTIAIRISGDGFLRYMVRRIAGSLIEIGSGRLETNGLAIAIEPHFGEARWTAPAAGLTLTEVAYDKS